MLKPCVPTQVDIENSYASYPWKLNYYSFPLTATRESFSFRLYQLVSHHITVLLGTPPVTLVRGAEHHDEHLPCVGSPSSSRRGYHLGQHHCDFFRCTCQATSYCSHPAQHLSTDLSALLSPALRSRKFKNYNPYEEQPLTWVTLSTQR